MKILFSYLSPANLTLLPVLTTIARVFMPILAVNPTLFPPVSLSLTLPMPSPFVFEYMLVTYCISIMNTCIFPQFWNIYDVDVITTLVGCWS